MVRNPSVEVGHLEAMDVLSVLRNEMEAQDLRNKALLLAASIDMVHGTKKKKWTTACKGNSFIRRSI
jgi:hypothetical protein